MTSVRLLLRHLVVSMYAVFENYTPYGLSWWSSNKIVFVASLSRVSFVFYIGTLTSFTWSPWLKKSANSASTKILLSLPRNVADLVRYLESHFSEKRKVCSQFSFKTKIKSNFLSTSSTMPLSLLKWVLCFPPEKMLQIWFVCTHVFSIGTR